MNRMLMALGVCAALLPVAAAGGAATEDNFHLRTTGDLAALCGAEPTDPLMTAAVNFCHGFGVGVFRVLRAQAAARPAAPQLFCVPDPAPSRNEAIAAFVRWARANPGAAGLPPEEGLVRFLAQQYPCRSGR